MHGELRDEGQPHAAGRLRPSREQRLRIAQSLGIVDNVQLAVVAYFDAAERFDH